MTGPEPRPIVATLPRYSSVTGLDRVTWKASSNEATIEPAPEAIAAAQAASESAHLYPSLTGAELAHDIAAQVRLESQQVVVGGGSITLLQQVLLTYCQPGDEVIHAWRSYEAYPIVVAVAGALGVPIPLDAEHRHDLPAMLAAITNHTRLIIVCNPNNPTSTDLDLASFRKFMRDVPENILVLLDEAYFEFAEREIDGSSLLGEYPNLVVLRTFSKAYALAGLRVGYLMAHANIADAIRTTSLPFGVSAPASAAARAALARPDRLAPLLKSVAMGRERLRRELSALVKVPLSSANFVWLPLGDRSLEFAEACADRGVSVRAFAGEGVRVTVGAPEVNQIVLEVANQFWKERT